MNAITSLATNGVTEAWTLLLNFLILIVLAGVLFFFSHQMGRSAFVALVASLYVGFAVYTVFPFADALHTGSAALNVTITSLILYTIFVALSYYILRRNMGGALFSTGNVGIGIICLLTAGFLIALAYHSFSLRGVYTFPEVIEMYFAPAKYFFWWFIAPLVGLLAFAR